MGEAPKVGKVDPCQQSRSVTSETVFQRMPWKTIRCAAGGFAGLFKPRTTRINGVTLNPTCPENFKPYKPQTFDLINPKL